jgi:hypothetical protein
MKFDLNNNMFNLIRSIVENAYELASNAQRHILWKRACPKLSDVDFVIACIIRAISKVDSALEFLQDYEQIHKIKIPESTWFDACSNPRRLQMFEALSPFIQIQLKEKMGTLSVDYLSPLPGIENSICNAFDGHFMQRSVHSKTTDPNASKKPTAGFLFGIDLSCGLLQPVRVVSDGSACESEIPGFKDWYMETYADKIIKEKRITVYDRAISEFDFWKDEAKHNRHIVTRSKKNFKFNKKEAIDWERRDLLNTGVTGDYKVTKKIKGKNYHFRIVHYFDPQHDQNYEFLTTLPASIPPGVIAELYRRRWQIEKVFDNTKNDLRELKGWGKSRESLGIQMHSVAAAYNLIRLFHEMNIVENDGGSHTSQIKHEKRCFKIDANLARRGYDLPPLFWLGHLMRISRKTIKSVQNFLKMGEPLEQLFKALSKEIVMQT